MYLASFHVFFLFKSIWLLPFMFFLSRPLCNFFVLIPLISAAHQAHLSSSVYLFFETSTQAIIVFTNNEKIFCLGSIYSGSISQRLVAFHWVYPSVDSGQFGRKAVSDIDVLIVDRSYTVSEKETFKQGPCLLMKPTSNPGYVRLFKGRSIRSRCISSKGFRKYWRGLVDQVELFTRYTGRGDRFPDRGKDVTGTIRSHQSNIIKF